MSRLGLPLLGRLLREEAALLLPLQSQNLLDQTGQAHEIRLLHVDLTESRGTVWKAVPLIVVWWLTCALKRNQYASVA